MSRLRLPEWLLKCLRRQVVNPWASDADVELTTFGRALILEEQRWHPGYVLYWVRLPSYWYGPDWLRRRPRWHQRVLFWHGRDGFEVRLVPVQLDCYGKRV